MSSCEFCGDEFDAEDGSWAEDCERDHCHDCWSLCAVCSRTSLAPMAGLL